MLVAMAERRSEQGPCIHTKNEVTGMGGGSGKILTVLTLMNYVLKLANFLLHVFYTLKLIGVRDVDQR